MPPRSVSIYSLLLHAGREGSSPVTKASISILSAMSGRGAEYLNFFFYIVIVRSISILSPMAVNCTENSLEQGAECK